MYLSHFQLEQMPFSLTPNTAFYVELIPHQQAFEVLQTALSAGEGFIKIVGEVGTGKTLLCRKLLHHAQENWRLAYVPDPCLSPTELRWALAAELGLQYSGNIDHQQLQQLLQRHLMLLAARQQQVILVIDEAQALPDETLEALRLLTNLETEQRKLIQVVLFAQPELDQRLQQHRFRQLRQRISFSYQLRAMTAAEVFAYVQARLAIAGNPQLKFSMSAMHLLANASRGIPRLVNLLAHKALMLAYGKGQQSITRGHIRAAAYDTEDVKCRRYYGLIAMVVSLFAVLVVSAWWYWGRLL
ncbi:AAA family ATPase [Alkalimonas collagenimarina]|uniref:AAA family ATPase n=1 Tax=Alkalimonas collagenimarina TaxID=400390 RepID=A0ABT9H399_9GAMM|nr:AAA family ATPase [Alkalimonas collagenimarina]MDP4537767.1 AAA family ATPase [Alkalimonas collagenimarina]